MTKFTILRALTMGAAPVALIAATPALAQSAGDLKQLREEIAAMRADQQRAMDRIAQLESQLAAAQAAPVATASTAAAPQAAAGQPSSSGGLVQFPGTQVAQSPAAPINPAGGSAPGATPPSIPSKLTINGDLRVRYESNFGDNAARDRDRGVIRARLRAAYAVNPWLTVGTQIATGDNDDPNSTDQTLGNFVDDLTVSLDQAYMRGTFGGLTLTAGKIPQPFVRTELVWDGDVNPQGLSASYKMALGGGASIKTNGIYFLVDEATAGEDSRMIGGQLQFETAASAPVKFELAAGYYDYRLSSLAGGDTGDFRTNRFAAGRYLSDFNLLDVIGAVQFNGLGERWPVRIVGDYVHNFGATTSEDSGFGVDLLVGRGSKLHDWRFGYGYAEMGVDGVLAAFSHDNTNLATNYLQHTALIDYVVANNVILNATYYRYRAKSPLFTTAFSTTDWVDRLRLNLLVNF